MKKLLVGCLAAWALCSTSSLAHADGTVELTLSPEGQDFANQVGLNVEEIEMELTSAVNDAFALLDLKPYLRAFADAASFSNRGLGADYAIETDGFIVGFGANAAVSVDEDFDPDADRPVGGVAANLSFLLGANLARWDLPNLTVYGNFFRRGISVEQFSGNLTSAGAHAQYKLFGPGKATKKDLVARWGGIDLTSGLEYSQMTLSLAPEDAIETDLPIEGDDGQVDLRMVSTGRLDFNTKALTIPFEATTSLRALYFLSIYGGVGLDVQLGSASVDGNVNGTIRGERPDNGETVDVATADITLTEDSGPSAGKLRFLVGAQVNLWRLKAFVQLNTQLPTTASIAAGLRIVL